MPDAKDMQVDFDDDDDDDEAVSVLHSSISCAISLIFSQLFVRPSRNFKLSRQNKQRWRRMHNK